MAKLTAGDFSDFGRLKIVSNVSSSQGDRRRPNPQTFSVLKAGGTHESTAWYGSYSNEIIAYRSDLRGSSGVGSLPSEISIVTVNSTILPTPWLRLEEENQKKMYDKLRGNSELVVDLLEGKKTLQMVKSALLAKRYLLATFRDITRSPRYTAKTVANKWLEYRYGWTPLAYSLYDACDNTLRSVRENPFVVKTRSRTAAKESYGGRVVNGLNSEKSWFVNIESSTRVETCYTFKPEDPTVQQIANWTSLNPASIAWELVPLSFVVDWFVNVGDSLRAWENWMLYRSSFQGGYRTRTVKEVRSAGYRDGVSAPVPEYHPSGDLVVKSYGSLRLASISGTYVSKDRTVVLSLPSPASPRLEANLNAKRIADAAALTSSAWSKLLSGRSYRRLNR